MNTTTYTYPLSPEEWNAAWAFVQEVMDSENGEESMVVLHEYVKWLARNKPPEIMPPKCVMDFVTWRWQTGRSQWDPRAYRRSLESNTPVPGLAEYLASKHV